MDSEKSTGERGLIMVYTGPGKGKTTAAVGQALRALGHGYRVYMIHFMKGRDYGEFLSLENFSSATVVKAGRDEFVKRGDPDPVDLELAKRGFAHVSEALKSGKYDIVVMDEINVAMDFGLIPVQDVVKLLKSKPSGIDVILTGRNAPAEIIDVADLASEVKEIKHHYQAGVNSRKGIEY